MNSYSEIPAGPPKRWYLNWVLKDRHFRRQKAINQCHGGRKQLLEEAETVRKNSIVFVTRRVMWKVVNVLISDLRKFF